MLTPNVTFRSPYFYFGTSGDDTLTSRYAGAVNETFYGYEGNDYIDGGYGADRMYGGAGHDTYVVDNAGDQVVETADGGFDTVRVSFSYTIPLNVEVLQLTGSAAINATGSDMADRLYGNSSSNILWGLGGNDILDGGAGTDTMIGGTGHDTYYVDNAGDVVVEYTGEGTDWVAVSFSYTLGQNVENMSLLGTAAANLTGNELDNQIHGNGYANVLTGAGGDDRLYAGNGDDTLFGGDGADLLDGSFGIDTMAGGTGSDVYLVDHQNDTVNELAGQGSDEVRTRVSWTLTDGADVETLRTSDDIGTQAIDLTANNTGNVVVGNDGNNVLNGRGGNDELTGRAGADSFLFNAPLDAASNVDVITDFDVADDTIVLENAVFTGLNAGAPLGAMQFAIGAAAQDATDRIIYNDVTGDLLFDVDGVGGTAAVLFAEVSPGLALTNLDFLIV
jgi:Ca2+-binding RTX toxin-like protein